MDNHFTLFSNDDFVFLQPSTPNRSVLKITRPSGNISLISASDFSASSYGPFDRSIRCYGIYGLIDLLAGKYLIIVTDQSFIGTLPLKDASVLQITGVQIIPCGKKLQELNARDRADEVEFLSLLDGAFHVAPLASGFYYSHQVPLTQSLQSQFPLSKDSTNWKLSDENATFAVNLVHLNDFKAFASKISSDVALELADFLCICIQGFVEVRDLMIKEERITFALISRRDTSRTGARYQSRGIDKRGKVSNFVETEQMIFTSNGGCSAYLQIRGSIPLFWRQNVRIKYKPELEIVKPVEDAVVQDTFRLHRDALLERYGRVSVANLVDSHGGEGQLATAFKYLSSLDRETVSKLWAYFEFDFHKECSHMAYHNIEKLITQLKNNLDSYETFEGNFIDGSVSSRQSGVVRTNCMDCLDRTNVVQSVLAKRALIKQLKDFKIFSSDESDIGPIFEGIFRNVWADNADAISTQYSGTGALKTDFTRTGKRSTRGAIQDGINSALRYYFGNFSDGTRQDSLDLLFGAYTINHLQGYQSPFQGQSPDWIKFFIKWALILLFIIFFAMAHLDIYNRIRTLGMGLCALIIVLLIKYVQRDGKRFVNYPRLIPTPLALKYNKINRTTMKGIKSD